MSKYENVIRYFFLITPVIISSGCWAYYLFLRREKKVFAEALEDGIWANHPDELSKQTKEKILRAIIAGRTWQATLAFRYAVIFTSVSISCIILFWRY